MRTVALESTKKPIDTQISFGVGQLYFNLGIKQAKNKSIEPVYYKVDKASKVKRVADQPKANNKQNATNDSYNSLEVQDIYMKQAGEYKVLSREEEIKLFKLLEKGNKTARDTIVNHNLRLVVSNAYKYSNRGVDVMDLIQEGNIGLMAAIRRFDYKRGYKFSTYATYWIVQTIMRHISSRGRTIKVPAKFSEVINKYRYMVDKFISKNGYYPSIEEASEELDIEPEELQEILRTYEYTDSYSLDFLMSNEESDNVTLVDFIPDPDPLPEENSVLNDIKDTISTILTELSEREETVLRMRYGLDDGKPRTLEDIGKIFGVTREWICQIERNAINKLGKGPYAKELKEMFLQSGG